MSRLEQLKKAQSIRELAELLGFKPKSVSYILYIMPEDSKYIEFEIPKKNGKTRKIKSPNEKLKVLQRRLADLLNDCFDLINKESKEKPLSHGFRKKLSIATNAKNHKNKRYVFNVDLQDFFPSMNFGRVRGFFIKNNHFKLDPKVATVIAQIACHNNELPQGSPCSPIISNLIGHLLDIRMANLAKMTKCTYSRYADDLTFSTNKKDFPEFIAVDERDNNWVAGKKLVSEIQKVNFAINPEKTSMQFKTSRQTTTGLVVNEKVNIKREYYKNARSMCHELFNRGEFYIGNKEEKGTLEQLEGILSFIFKIKRAHDTEELGTRRHKPTAITKLYREFLFYKHFFSAKYPVFICEGKTDIIYLKCALKKLALSYNDLVENNNNEINYKIKFLNFSKNLRDIFSISTGAPGLNHLIDMYEKNIIKFKSDGKKSPVIVVLDNDDGLDEIKKKLKEKNLNQEKTIFHYAQNLYVLVIPREKGKSIEDLFDPVVLNIKIDGKKFNRGKKIDTGKEYGKFVFAEKVVKANQENISFERFKEVFDNVRFIINNYKNRV
jgi:RNA-directed DNA polymerase